MEIKTKYDIGDLVVIEDEETKAYRIIGIDVKVTADVGAQPIYRARGLERDFNDRVKAVTIDTFPDSAILGKAKDVPSSNPLAAAARERRESEKKQLDEQKKIEVEGIIEPPKLLADQVIAIVLEDINSMGRLRQAIKEIK